MLIVILSLGFGFVERVSPLIYLLQGCVSAAFVLAFNSTAALLADYAPPERLGQAIGWLGGANVAMNAVATMVAEPLAAAYGWRAVFELGIAAGAAAFVLSFSLRAAPPREHAVHDDPTPALPPLSQLLPLLAATSLMGAVFVAVFGFVQPYALSLGAREVRTFFVGYTFAAVGCRLALGGLGDRVGRRGMSMCLLGGYALAALVMRELHVELLMLYGVGFGAVHGLLYPTLNALLLELLPQNRRGLGMVLYNGAFNLGSSCGSFAWGSIAQQRGYPPVYTLAAGFAVGAAALLHKRGDLRFRHTGPSD